LPVVVARVSRPYTGGSLADATDVRGETVLRAIACRPGFFGLSNCLGASTTTSGSEVTPPTRGPVCDIAGPVRLHSNAVDRIATAEGATRLDDILMTRSPKSGHQVLVVGPLQPSRVAERGWRGRLFWPAQPGFGWQGEHVLVRVHRYRFSPNRKLSVTGSIRCISRISACVRFEILRVGRAGRYITLQNRVCACLAVGYSGVYGEPGPHSRRRR
jgi:hypothetical protein